MTDSLSTPFPKQAEILAELWLNHKDEPDFEDFFDYNDLGLPLAYAIFNDIVKTTDTAEVLIGETFSLLVATLGLDDLGFETLEEMLDDALPTED